jgi:hypothetical protein
VKLECDFCRRPQDAVGFLISDTWSRWVELWPEIESKRGRDPD